MVDSRWTSYDQDNLRRLEANTAAIRRDLDARRGGRGVGDGPLLVLGAVVVALFLAYQGLGAVLGFARVDAALGALWWVVVHLPGAALWASVLVAVAGVPLLVLTAGRPRAPGRYLWGATLVWAWVAAGSLAHAALRAAGRAGPDDRVVWVPGVVALFVFVVRARAVPVTRPTVRDRYHARARARDRQTADRRAARDAARRAAGQRPR